MALEARLIQRAQTDGIDLARLRLRVAFERFLARLVGDTHPRWLLKGGFALEMRLAPRARATRDLDLALPDPESLLLAGQVHGPGSVPMHLHEFLQAVVERDLGDGYRFLVRAPAGDFTQLAGGGVRFAVEAMLAGRLFSRFHVDVGIDDVLVGETQWVESSALLMFGGLPPILVPLISPEQQFAEKLHAYSYPWQGRENTRVKDLVDMILLLEAGQLDRDVLLRAVQVTFERRATHVIPVSLPSPPMSWAEPFQAMASELRLLTLTLEEGRAYVDAFWQRSSLG